MSVLRSRLVSLRQFTAIRQLHSTTIARADPYPLPLDPSLHPSSSSSASSSTGKQDGGAVGSSEGGYVDMNTTSQSESLGPLPQPLDRSGEDEATMRARLVYQSRKRGMLEGDLLLSTFAKDQLGTMSLDELREFDKLLDEPDWDIYYWSIDKREPPPRWKDTPLLNRLRKHARNEGKVVRVMPDLMQSEPQ